MTGDLASVNAWLEQYRRRPDVSLLLWIAEGLAGPGTDPADPARAGISAVWLREQGELVAGMSVQRVRDDSGCTVQELFRLRRVFSRMNVPCGGWAVSAEDIDASLLRQARDHYGQAVARMSPYHGWKVFELWVEGYIPRLDTVAPGARDVVIGYAVRYVKDEMEDQAGRGSSFTLEKLAAVFPALDQAARDAFQRAGIPVGKAALEHAAKVSTLRRRWEQLRDGREIDHLRLALVCRPVLAEETIGAAEISTTREAVWAEARQWVTAQVRRIEDGDHDALSELSSFATFSGLELEAFGLGGERLAGWWEARARDCWARAQDGDGEAAFDVLCHCSGEDSSYERTTGLPEDQARATLHAIMEAFTVRLRRQVETAASRKWALAPFQTLRDFIGLIEAVNENAAERDGRPLVGPFSWQPTRQEWREFYDRYVDDD